MKCLGLDLHVLRGCVVASMLAGCSGSQPPIGTPGAIPQNSSVAPESPYKVLHRFRGVRDSDGAYPLSALIEADGTLYGTTEAGGVLRKGTVYSISTSGTEKVMHSFSGGSDGAAPEAPLIDVKGTFYGTTFYGGIGGTIYSINPKGVETVLYGFPRYNGGEDPEAAVIDVQGTLYGTTLYGGRRLGRGTVYRVSTAGKEKALHQFSGPDGANPAAALLDVGGTLYGTTIYGGLPGLDTPGAVFSITPAGKEKVLYRFAGGSDGSQPINTLVNVKGTLYGTTDNGGSDGCNGNGCGTVYSVTTAGSEKVLYRFTGGSDGAIPHGGLINVRGMLYGTTVRGGGTGCKAGAGCGTIYSIDTAGHETVLYRFRGGFEGANPVAGLIDVNGKLYGTTAPGGVEHSPKCHGDGSCGTVFAFTL